MPQWGERLGSYMILVDELTPTRIREVVADLLRSGEFSTAFERFPREPSS